MMEMFIFLYNSISLYFETLKSMREYVGFGHGRHSHTILLFVVHPTPIPTTHVDIDDDFGTFGK